MEELRRESRHKEVIVLELEEESERKIATLKEQSAVDRRRLVAEWEEKVRIVAGEREGMARENDELRELVTRQHKALQLQNEQYEEVVTRNEELT